MRTTNNLLLKSNIERICRMNVKRAGLAAIRSSTPFGNKLVSLLNSTATLLPTLLTDFPAILEVSFSRGMGNLPSVLWIAIVQRGRTVSTSMSATICFGTSGEGIVCGLMSGGYYTSNKYPPLKRLETEIAVNVNGPKPESQYNNKFFNPKEFLIDNLDSESVIDHMNVSLKLLEECVNNR